MREIKYDGQYLQIAKIDNWEYVTRKNANGAVIIIPVDGQELVMIKEFRVPLQCRVLGFPAGLVGDKASNEDVFAAARREMVEEVGLLPNSLKLLIENSPSSSGLTDETFSMLLAQDLVEVGKGGGDETEDIEVVRVPLSKINLFLKELDKSILISPKVYIGLFFLQRFGYVLG